MVTWYLFSAALPPGPNQANQPLNAKARAKPAINPASSLAGQCRPGTDEQALVG